MITNTTVNSIILYTHILLKASGCLEVKEWELGDLKDTKSGVAPFISQWNGVLFF